MLSLATMLTFALVSVTAQTTIIPLMSTSESTTMSNQKLIIATTLISGILPNPPTKPNTSTNLSSNFQQSPSSQASSETITLLSGPSPSQTWDTSVLCRHLANLTRQKPTPAAENAVEEPIDAKCFPGFACVNGVCTGGMSCKCFEGWAGLFCQAPCPADCSPGGHCMTSTSNQAICVCNETSKYTPGVGCVEKPPEFFTTTTPAPPTTPRNLRPHSERECFGAFTCLHGYCQFATLQCACDPGWKGQLCDEPCQLNCSNHGRCLEDDEFSLRCSCEPNYSGEFCEIMLHKPSTSLQQNSSLAKVDMSAWTEQDARTKTSYRGNNMTEKDKNATETKDGIDKTSTSLPLIEKKCKPGLSCKNGNCTKDQRICVCNPGWVGTFCDVACDLQCKNNGTCIIDNSKLPRCQCRKGFFGKTCRHTSTVVISNKTRSSSDYPWMELAGQKTKLAPLSQRLCYPGFLCAYGTCSRYGTGLTQCLCDPKYTGEFCQTPCPLDCGKLAQCEFNSTTKSPGCVCDNTGVYPDCSRETAGPMSPAQVASIATILTLCSGVLLFLVVFKCYRSQNLTIMKVIYRFQGYEDDSNKDYDVFVLYTPADLDRQFVIQTLIPRLEGRMCLTVNLHQGNVLRETSTTNSLAELIQRTHRIVIVLSPSFLAKQWDDIEDHTVLQGMIKRRQKLVVITLGDVCYANVKNRPQLKKMLKSVVNLVYPVQSGRQQELEDFWTRLELMMPKKRSTHLEFGKGQSCLTSVGKSSTLQLPQDSKAPLELRLFRNEKLRTHLLQRIIRVPASKLDSGQQQPQACPSLDRITSSDHSQESCSQNTIFQASSAHAYIPLHHSESTQNIIDEEVVDSPNEAANSGPAPDLPFCAVSNHIAWKVSTAHAVHNDQRGTTYSI